MFTLKLTSHDAKYGDEYELLWLEDGVIVGSHGRRFVKDDNELWRLLRDVSDVIKDDIARRERIKRT